MTIGTTRSWFYDRSTSGEAINADVKKGPDDGSKHKGIQIEKIHTLPAVGKFTGAEHPVIFQDYPLSAIGVCRQRIDISGRNQFLDTGGLSALLFDKKINLGLQFSGPF
jgi:hypothetical protein